MFRKKPNAVVRELPHGIIHAVERLSLGFDFASPLDAQSMAKLSALGNQIATLLPRKLQVSTSGMIATVGNVGTEQPSASDAEIFAILFDDNEDQDGPIDDKHAEIIIHNDSFNFAVYARYDGWEKTRTLALELYRVFYDAIIESATPSSVDFRVSNVFGLENFTGSLNDLLNENCDSLPRRVFNAKGLWHVDEGYFDSHAHADMKQLLVNLSVSKSIEDELENLYIRTMHQFDFPENFSGVLSLDSLFEKFEHMHTVNKALLASVLNSDISSALGLTTDRRITI